MSTLTPTMPGLLELKKRLGPDNELMPTIDAIAAQNEVIKDIYWIEANDILAHRSNRLNSRPAGTTRRINAGTPAQTSITEPQSDTLMMLEGWVDIDVKVAQQAGDINAFRANLFNEYAVGLFETFTSKLLYGNHTTTPDEFNGLAVRMATADGKRIQNNGGSGSDVSSIYMVQWGPNQVYCAYPKGSTMGIMSQDFDVVQLYDSNSYKYMAYSEWIGLHAGLVVANPKCMARVANIETSGASNTFNEDKLITAKNYMLNSGAGGVVYMNEAIYTQMEIRAKDKSNVWHMKEDPFGSEVLYFYNMPVRKIGYELLLNTETAIS